jgi:hypothetical protein
VLFRSGRLIQAVKTDGTVVNVAVPTYVNATTTTVAYTIPTSTDLMDISEAVVNYLKAPAASGGIGGLVSDSNLPLHRLTVKRLPNINPFGFKTIQPLRGAILTGPNTTCPAAPLP